MARQHVVFHVKREESPSVSLGNDDNDVTVRRSLPNSDSLAIIHDQTLHRQASTMSHCAPLCSTSQICGSKSPGERLADVDRRRLELRRDVERLQGEIIAMGTYCYYSGQTIVRLREQVYAKETTVHAKQILERHLEAMLEVQRENEELALKAAEDQARLTRILYPPCVFSGPLNKRRLKQELQDIAVALSLSVNGTKDDILERIMKEFEANPKLKSDPQFFLLFNVLPRKRRMSDVLLAASSTCQD